MNTRNCFCQLSRRQFLSGAGALGAGALLPDTEIFAQDRAVTRRIDIHHHFGSPDWVKMTADKRTQGFEVWQKYSPARSIEDMDKGNVETSYISITTPGIWFGDLAETRRLARRENEYGARIAADSKGRLKLLAVLPLPDVEASLREIEYAYDTLKADGIGLLSNWGQKWLSDESFRPVLDELNRRRAVVYTHGSAPGCCGGSYVPGVLETTIEYNTDVSRAIISLIQNGVADRTPNIRYVMSHGGGTIIGLAGRFLGAGASAENLAKTPEPNSRLHHLRRFYYDTAASTNPVIIEALKRLVGPSQIVFGTDFPFVTSSTIAAGLRNTGLTSQEMIGVDRDNAMRVFARA
ncbi:MAG: amidohydrolase family protein [Burkholderiales bacterium]